MEKVRILGIVGSPRKDGNTAKLVEEALEAIRAFPRVETDMFAVAGKKINHCVACYKCMEPRKVRSVTGTLLAAVDEQEHNRCG
jgi:multimeric flavodoxin WrbA